LGVGSLPGFSHLGELSIPCRVVQRSIPLNPFTGQTPKVASPETSFDEQEGPKREAERQKKQTDDLEATRQKNQKSFRP
jgi:hypothetical protein